MKGSFETERQISEGISWLATALILGLVSLLIVAIGYQAATLAEKLPVSNTPHTARGLR